MKLQKKALQNLLKGKITQSNKALPRHAAMSQVWSWGGAVEHYSCMYELLLHHDYEDTREKPEAWQQQYSVDIE